MNRVDAELSEEEFLDCPIRKLDQDSLICILSKLPIADLARVERVSKFWQEAALQSWTGIRKLFVTAKFLGLRSLGMDIIRRKEIQREKISESLLCTVHEIKEINEDMVEQILKRCGKSLKKIDVSAIYIDVSYLIGKYCKNIQSINCFYVSNKGIKKIAKNCTKISELAIHKFEDRENKKLHEALGTLFANNRNLKSLKLDKYHEISDDSLLKLPLEQMNKIEAGLTEENLESVLKHAKNLSNIYFRINNFKVFFFKNIIFNNVSNLISLELISDDFTDKSIDSLLSQVFRNNRQLKTIKLSDFDYLSGKCFVDLNASAVEEITLNNNPRIQGVELMKSWPYFENFHRFRYVEYHENDFYRIAECIGACSNFKEFVFNYINDCYVKDVVKCFSSSKNVEKLTFNFVLEVDEVCHYISENLPELRYLKLGENVNVTARGLESLCKLEKLKELEIKELSYEEREECETAEIESIGKLRNLEVLKFCWLVDITGAGLGGLSNLKKLICYYSLNLEDDHLISLLRCADNLELLDIENCEKITNRVIDVAIEVTKKRTNNILLQINIYNTAVDIYEIKEHSTLLYLRKDECSEYE